ncbi:DNA polymerase epsilon subunit 4 [Lethenteron reissneri]|uniref:DNA polymerase epsilon subunit 4 n=1 Tax=Lethenteron reissneri TaxID=7753 RepID=UPI002AB6FEFC|nr:DNA polymerase epsilon subunit 4 [Lethenteron reissneri]
MAEAAVVVVVGEEERPRLSRLPLSRVKSIMKADPDVALAAHEAVFLIAKATELFIEAIAKDAYGFALQGKRKTLQRKDLDNAVDAVDEFAFLEGEQRPPLPRLSPQLGQNTHAQRQRSPV